MREWGVRFRDGSVRHPWNGSTSQQRAHDELWRLRGVYTPDRFDLVTRASRDAPWVLFCEYGGMMVAVCQQRDLCDCLDHGASL